MLYLLSQVNIILNIYIFMFIDKCGRLYICVVVCLFGWLLFVTVAFEDGHVIQSLIDVG